MFSSSIGVRANTEGLRNFGEMLRKIVRGTEGRWPLTTESTLPSNTHNEISPLPGSMAFSTFLSSIFALCEDKKIGPQNVHVWLPRPRDSRGQINN